MAEIATELPEATDQSVTAANNAVDFTADDTADVSWGPDELVVVDEAVQEVKNEVEDGQEKVENPDEPKASYACDLCKATFEGQTQEVHEKLPRHQKMVARMKKYGTTEITPEMHTFHCHICGTISNSPEQLLIHKNGSKHRTRCLNLSIDPDLTEAPPNARKGTGESLSCNVCMVMASSLQQLNQHLSGKKHKEKIRQLQSNGGQNTSKKKTSGQQQMPEGQRHPWNDGADSGHAFRSGAAKAKNVAQAGKPASKRAHEADGEEATAAKKRASGSQPDGATDTAKPLMPFYCDTCSIYLNSSFQMNEHIKGKVHLDRLQKNGKGTDSSEAHQADGSNASEATSAPGDAAGASGKKAAKKQTEPMTCKVCKLTLNSMQQYTQHVTSRKHKMKAEGSNMRRPFSGFLRQRSNAPFRKNPGTTGNPVGHSTGYRQTTGDPLGLSTGYRQRGPSMNGRPGALNMGALAQRPRSPTAAVRPRGPGIGMRSRGPGMEMRPQGPGMEMRSQGPGMNMRSQGPGLGMRPQGPGMNMRHQGLEMDRRDKGPGMGMNIRPQGLGIGMSPQGPGITMRSQRAGMTMRPQGPGMDMRPQRPERAMTMRPQGSPLAERTSGPLDFQLGHQLSGPRQARGHAATEDFVDALAPDQDYRDADYRDSGYDHGYDNKECGYRQPDDYGNAEYSDPSYDEYGHQGPELEDTYGPASFEGPCQEGELYSEGSGSFSGHSFPSRIATYGERRSDIERGDSMIGHYEDRPLMERYGRRPSMMGDPMWNTGVFSRRRPLVDF